MKLSIWDLFKYLYKWKFAVIAVTVVSVILSGIYVDRHQTYTSKVVIQYTTPCIKEGKTLNGGDFDYNEIKSQSVILSVLEELGYNKKKVDSVREKIQISAITPSSVTAIKTAKEKLGEEYKYNSDTYLITYSGGGSFESTRDTLSSVVSNYFKYFSETYLYLAALNEVDYDMNKKNFDYLEQAELIENNVKDTIDRLGEYAKGSGDYRSPIVGLTFDDLLTEFEALNEFDIPKLFAKIYDGQVTMDKKLLIDKYTQRMDECVLNMQNLKEKEELAKNRMEAYVNANRNVPNSYNENIMDNNDNVEIINDLDENYIHQINEQTTYDSLIKSYAADAIAANNDSIDAAYNRLVAERFSAEPNPQLNYTEYEAAVQEDISDILTKLKTLYEKANIMVSGYNEYIPTLYIKKLSGVGCYENVSKSLYKMIAAVLGFGFSVMAVFAYEIIKKYAEFAENGDEE